MHHHKRPRRRFSAIRRVLLATLALLGGLVLAAWMELRDTAVRAEGQKPAADRVAQDAPSLADLAAGKLAIIDLGWPLNRESAYWPGENYKPFDLHTIATLEKDGVLSKAFSSPEHLGTHLDAPNHFEAKGLSVDKIPVEQFFSPGVVVDVSRQVGADADYLISLEDIRDFEVRHGRIPAGAVVLAYTGWSKLWNNPIRYQGRGVMGKLHFPGFSAEAVEFLISARQVRGVGLDTMSVDHGPSRDFAVHHLLGKANRYGLENLTHLDQLPARGFFVLVAPMKIETGSGGPARVFAVLAKGGDEN
jgi:kynurenine formamidase